MSISHTCARLHEIVPPLSSCASEAGKTNQAQLPRAGNCAIKACSWPQSTCHHFKPYLPRTSVSPLETACLGKQASSRTQRKLGSLAAVTPGSDASLHGDSKPMEDLTSEISPPDETVISVSTKEARAHEKRTATITVHGVGNDEDARRLNALLKELEGIEDAWIGPFIEGGLRGGSVTLQLEAEKGVPLKEVVKDIQALEKELLVLPFKYNSWLWRGHKIKFAAAGCGNPVLLVHGFGGNAGHFSSLISYLADHYRVYAVDLLGFGSSDKPREVSYGPDLWADLICDFIEEFCLEGAVLVGNSIGSLTALAAAAKGGRNAVRGLVLLNCAGAMNRKGLTQDDALLRIISPIFVAVEYLLQRPRIANFLFDKFRSKENVRKILQEQAYRNEAAVTSQLVDILHHPSTDPGAVDVFVKVFTGEPGPRPEELMPHIDVPLLLLWGEMDRWTPANGPVANYFRKLATERDNVEVHVLADVGHCPHDDRPELAAAKILPFLENVDWDSQATLTID